MKRPWNRRARPREPRPLTRLYDPVEGNLLPIGLDVGSRSGGTTASGGRSPSWTHQNLPPLLAREHREPTSGVAASRGRLATRDQAAYILGSRPGETGPIVPASMRHLGTASTTAGQVARCAS